MDQCSTSRIPEDAYVDQAFVQFSPAGELENEVDSLVVVEKREPLGKGGGEGGGRRE